MHGKSRGKLMQRRIWFWVFVGSTVGGFIPDLWGSGIFSYSAVLLSAVGAIAGVWIGYKLS
jgi:hypothetical protein